MKQYVRLIYAGMFLLVAGCQIPAAIIASGTGAMPVYPLDPEPNYDAPPQVIYSIDENRFFSSENYERCSFGHIYYNDRITHTKTLVGNALATFPGRLHLDGNPDVLVFPTVPSNESTEACNDRGCHLITYYSLDGGKTFRKFHPWRLNMDGKSSYEKAKSISVTLEGKHLYLSNERIADKFVLYPGILGGGEYVEGGSAVVPRIRTPSGQDRLTCDDSIHPKEIVE